jgi:hypothetical protein
MFLISIPKSSIFDFLQAHLKATRAKTQPKLLKELAKRKF